LERLKTAGEEDRELTFEDELEVEVEEDENAV
jgi:hypothetical protein